MAASTICYWNPSFHARISARKPLPKAISISAQTAITSVNFGFSRGLCPPIKLIPHHRLYEKFVVTNHLSGDEPEIEPKLAESIPFPLASMHDESSETSSLPVKVGGPVCDSGDDVRQGLNEFGEVLEITESLLFLARIMLLWSLTLLYLKEKTRFGICCGSEEVAYEKIGPMEMKDGYGLKIVINESSFFLNHVILLWVITFIFLNGKKQGDIGDVIDEGCGSEVVAIEKCAVIEMKNHGLKKLKGDKDVGQHGILRSLVSAVSIKTWIVILIMAYVMSFSKGEILLFVAKGFKNYICWWRKPKVFSAEWFGQQFMQYYGVIHSLAAKYVSDIPHIIPKQYRTVFWVAFMLWTASLFVPIFCITLVWRCLCLLGNWVKSKVLKS